MKLSNNLSPFLLFTLLIVGIATYIGCTKDTLDESINNLQLTNRSIYSNPLFEFSYEVETFTKVKPLFVTTSKIDKLTAEPIVGKQKVNLEVNELGDTYLVIENMVPTIDLTIARNLLPNNQPIPHKSIYHNGEMTLFSSIGTELYSTPVETFKMPEVALMVKNAKSKYTSSVLNQVILSMHSIPYRAKLDSMLAFPGLFGVSVGNVNQNIVSITIPPVDANSAYGETVLLIDRVRNLLLGSKLYDEKGDAMICLMIQYSTGPVPTIIAIRNEVMETLPSGGKALVESISTFMNMSLVVN